MPSYTITVNKKQHTVEAPADMPLLWVLRDLLGLTGTKYGCGVSNCGACTVLINGKAGLACSKTIANCVNADITTIEGLSADGSHPVQKAWQQAGVPQCGYCQPGQMMAVVAMLEKDKHPSEETIEETMAGVLCRCGTYQRIKKAIHIAMEEMSSMHDPGQATESHGEAEIHREKSLRLS
jgi:aerobic-type carbon monoxide dehydrogenase small subunit (CoxS/CutS family)